MLGEGKREGGEGGEGGGSESGGIMFGHNIELCISDTMNFIYKYSQAAMCGWYNWSGKQAGWHEQQAVAAT